MSCRVSFPNGNVISRFYNGGILRDDRNERLVGEKDRNTNIDYKLKAFERSIGERIVCCTQRV